MARVWWLAIYALAAAAEMLAAWAREHAEKRVRGDDERKDEVV